MGKVIIVGIIVLCVVFFLWVALLPNPDKVKAQKEAEKRRREYLMGERCSRCGSTDIEDLSEEKLEFYLNLAQIANAWLSSDGDASSSDSAASSSDSTARASLASPKRCKQCGNIFWV